MPANCGKGVLQADEQLHRKSTPAREMMAKDGPVAGNSLLDQLAEPAEQPIIGALRK